MKAGCFLIVVFSLAAPFVSADSSLESHETFKSTLDAIHSGKARGEGRQDVMMKAADLRMREPDSGYGEVLIAEYLSTLSLDQDGQPQEVFDEIMRLTGDAIELNPQLAEAHVPAARAMIRAALFSQAEEHLNKALSLNTELASAIFLRAELQRRSGHPLQAVSDYERFIEMAPSAARAANGYYWLAQSFREAALIDPQNSSQYIRQARASYQSGIDLDPDDPTRLANYAIFLNEIDEPEAAAAMLRRALEMSDFGLARWHLALAEYQLLARDLDRVDGQNLLMRVTRVAQETQVSIFDAVHYARHWPTIQSRLEPLAKMVEANYNRIRSDPEAAWNEALKISDPALRHGPLIDALKLWAEGDFRQGLERIGDLDSQADRTSFRQVLLEMAARAQPRAALGMLEELTDKWDRVRVVSVAMTTLAEQGPDAALTMVDELPPPLRATGAQSVLVVLSAYEPRRAAELYAASPYRAQITAGHRIVNQYAGSHPEEALAWAESVDGIGGEIWTMVLISISQQSTDKALQIVAAMPEGPAQEKALERVFRTVSANDPAEAARNSELLPEGKLRSSVASKAVSQWSNDEPIKALSWALTQPDSVAVVVLPNLAFALARVNVELAAAVPIEEIPEAARAQWIGRLVGPLAKNDPMKALAWLDPFKELPQYQDWRMRALGQVATIDPHGALALAAEAPDQESYAVSVSRILMNWAKSDGRAASTWLTTEYQGIYRSDLFKTVAASWYPAQPVPAEQWVMSLGDPVDREGGLLGIMSTLDVISPQREKLAGMLQLEESLEEEKVQRLMALISVDPDSAAVLLEEIELDQTRYDAIKKQIELQKQSMQWRPSQPD